MTPAKIHAARQPSLAYDRRGSGPPLVLLHGFGHNRRAWAAVMDLLAAERDVIAVDLPGFGDSPWPPGPRFGWDAVVAHLGAFIDTLDVGAPHVAGNSLGGLCGLELAKQGRVASVTALSPAAFVSVGGGLYVLGAIGGYQTLSMVAPDVVLKSFLRAPLLRNALLFTAFGRPWKVTDDAALDLMRSLRRAPSVLTNVTRIGNYRFTGGEDIDVPVTVSWGTRDMVLPPQQVRVARRALAQARMVPLPGCGHIPMSDDPELVARVILEGSAGPVDAGLRATS